jgi:hypothetical protein
VPNTRLYFDQQPVSDFAALLAKYPADEFASPTRSTVPLIALISSGRTLFGEILAQCGFSKGVDLHFEFTVAPPQGRGKSSHTDLMVHESPNWMAVEAKWTEPIDETVLEWLGPKESQTENRKAVLGGWLELINRFSARPLQIEDVGSLSYQLIHRAASACAQAGHPQLAYFQFLPNPRIDDRGASQRRDALICLHEALGRPARFPFHFVEIDLGLTPTFEKIATVSRSQMTLAVQNSLVSGDLLEFKASRSRSLSR